MAADGWQNLEGLWFDGINRNPVGKCFHDFLPSATGR
jgi:hypothetical protein